MRQFSIYAYIFCKYLKRNKSFSIKKAYLIGLDRIQKGININDVDSAINHHKGIVVMESTEGKKYIVAHGYPKHSMVETPRSFGRMGGSDLNEKDFYTLFEPGDYELISCHPGNKPKVVSVEGRTFTQRWRTRREIGFEVEKEGNDFIFYYGPKSFYRYCQEWFPPDDDEDDEEEED